MGAWLLVLPRSTGRPFYLGNSMPLDQRGFKIDEWAPGVVSPFVEGPEDAIDHYLAK